MDATTINEIQPRRVGNGDKAPDDLVCWLHAIHVCHVEAGNVYDMDGYRFFFLWYCEIAE